jgi:hypothetical protein
LKVTIDLPEDIAAALKGGWKDIPRQASRRSRSRGTARGHSARVKSVDCWASKPFEVHALLKEQRVPLHYTKADRRGSLRRSPYAVATSH